MLLDNLFWLISANCTHLPLSFPLNCKGKKGIREVAWKQYWQIALCSHFELWSTQLDVKMYCFWNRTTLIFTNTTCALVVFCILISLHSILIVMCNLMPVLYASISTFKKRKKNMHCSNAICLTKSELLSLCVYIYFIYTFAACVHFWYWCGPHVMTAEGHYPLACFVVPSSLICLLWVWRGAREMTSCSRQCLKCQSWRNHL